MSQMVRDPRRINRSDWFFPITTHAEGALIGLDPFDPVASVIVFRDEGVGTQPCAQEISRPSLAR